MSEIDRTITLGVLKKYCKENEIPIHVSASRVEVEAAIARFILNERTINPDSEIGCYGYWAEDDANCIVCVFKNQCAVSSLGMAAKLNKQMTARMDKQIDTIKAVRRRKK